MEVYILDSLLRRTQVVDKYESFIWTERFSDAGDFELQLKSTVESRGQFIEGTLLATNNSFRVMAVETVEDVTDSDGKKLLKIKGPTIEDVLNNRIAKYSMSDLTTEPKWIITDTPGNVARTMFDHICRDGALDLSDVIPFIQPGTIFSEDTIPESGTLITWEQSPDSLYNAIKSVCDLYDLGFRLVRNFDMSQLYFDIYAGNDRTTRQTVLTPVIFAVNLDNLQNTSEFTNIQNSKNVAYVFSPAGFEVVYGENVDPDVDGFQKRILYVEASDVTVDNPDISGALIQRGTEELAKHRAQTIFDGELDPNADYKYGVDYQVGDLVELRNIDGIITYKRVTEQIFVSDHEGERSYPTLSMDLFASANSWISFANKSTVWMDYDLDATTWADM